jgi:hypothetical protein
MLGLISETAYPSSIVQKMENVRSGDLLLLRNLYTGPAGTNFKMSDFPARPGITFAVISQLFVDDRKTCDGILSVSGLSSSCEMMSERLIR